MKAKKFLSSALKFVLLFVVGAFLALHSINLFSFVFPPDQQYLAWLGFGLTGFGAVAYLVMFLWEGATVLQRSVSLGMAAICSIGEVLAAIFGMQIESWRKAGFTLTEQDFQTMLLVIGLLSIAHFFALITYFAGDKIGELFADEDGDGIPNYRDRDYKKSNKGSSQQPKPRQPQLQQNTPQSQYDTDGLLRAMNMSREQALSHWKGKQYQDFAGEVSKHLDISGKNMRRVYYDLFPTAQGETNNGHR